MPEPLPILIENSIQIAWDYLDRTGQLGEPEIASRFLLDTVELMVRRGERRRLMLSNKATRKLLPQSLFRPSRAIALDDPFGSFVGMALGGIIANADNHTHMERAFRRGMGRFQRITHGCTQVVGKLSTIIVSPSSLRCSHNSVGPQNYPARFKKTR